MNIPAESKAEAEDLKELLSLTTSFTSLAGALWGTQAMGKLEIWEEWCLWLCAMRNNSQQNCWFARPKRWVNKNGKCVPAMENAKEGREHKRIESDLLLMLTWHRHFSPVIETALPVLHTSKQSLLLPKSGPSYTVQCSTLPYQYTQSPCSIANTWPWYSSYKGHLRVWRAHTLLCCNCSGQ